MNGAPPEAIVANFPALTLQQVHRALAFYTEHRSEIDVYLAAQQAKWDELRRESEAKNGALRECLRAYRSSQTDSDGR